MRLYNNSDSKNALATTSFFVTDTWTIDRLTLNLGARFDRYRAWLPEQTLPAGRFVPTAIDLRGSVRSRRLHAPRAARRRAPTT